MKTITLAFLLLLCGWTAFAQDPSKAEVDAAIKKFPTVPAMYMEAMIAAKQVMTIALPRWLPPGFKFEQLKVRLGTDIALEDREFIAIYSRKLPNGKTQRFALEAGFDGLGGLPYEPTKSVRSPFGRIDLMYEPKDPDDASKTLKNYVYTEWFKVGGKTDFHYIGMYGAKEGDDPGMAMISLAETERILGSLWRL